MTPLLQQQILMNSINRYYNNIFLPSDQGIILDFQDVSTMFQDNLGTVPITSIGQSILSIKDKVSQTQLCVFTGTPPVLQLDIINNVYYAQFPSGGGGHGSINVPSILNGNSDKSIICICTTAYPTNETLLLYGANATVGNFSLGSGPGFVSPPHSGASLFEQGAGQGISTDISVPSGIHQFIGTKNNLNLILYTDMITVSGSTSGSANITTSVLNVGYYPSLSGFDFESKMYSAVLINRTLSPTEAAFIIANSLH